MADMKKVYDDLIIINLYIYSGGPNLFLKTFCYNDNWSDKVFTLILIWSKLFQTYWLLVLISISMKNLNLDEIFFTANYSKVGKDLSTSQGQLKGL